MSPSDEQPGETSIENVRSGPTKVPVTAEVWDVVPQYQAEAEDALSRERIPRKYEHEVSRYYEALDEGRPEKQGADSTDGGPTE
jgi:hypothetical protein